MQPLSMFPQLLFLGPVVAPFLLRLVVSIFILHLAKERKSKEYPFSYLIYIVVGGLLFFGLYTQPASLVGIALIKFDFYLDYWKNRKIKPVDPEKYFLYFLAGIILFSLLFTGPGGFAFDLPL